jgi:hypothetical protein
VAFVSGFGKDQEPCQNYSLADFVQLSSSSSRGWILGVNPRAFEDHLSHPKHACRNSQGDTDRIQVDFNYSLALTGARIRDGILVQVLEVQECAFRSLPWATLRAFDLNQDCHRTAAGEWSPAPRPSRVACHSRHGGRSCLSGATLRIRPSVDMPWPCLRWQNRLDSRQHELDAQCAGSWSLLWATLRTRHMSLRFKSNWRCRPCATNWLHGRCGGLSP